MFNRVKYFITKNFKQSSTKERLNKIKNKVNNPKQSIPPIIIRKYNSSNTNFKGNNNSPPLNYIFSKKVYKDFYGKIFIKFILLLL